MVKKYSEFINYPIKLYLSKDVREEVEEEDQDDVEEVSLDGEEPEKKKKTKTVTKTVWEWETINEIKAIWMRDKSEITEREYNDFYKTISRDH